MINKNCEIKLSSCGEAFELIFPPLREEGRSRSILIPLNKQGALVEILKARAKPAALLSIGSPAAPTQSEIDSMKATFYEQSRRKKIEDANNLAKELNLDLSLLESL